MGTPAETGARLRVWGGGWCGGKPGVLVRMLVVRPRAPWCAGDVPAVAVLSTQNARRSGAWASRVGMGTRQVKGMKGG